MSASQEELVLRMGLNADKFEKDLREADRIAKMYGSKIGASMNLGGMNGSMPGGWASMSNLSQGSQNFIKGIAEEGIGAKLMERAAELVEIGGAAGAAIAPLKALYETMKGAWEMAKQGEVLGVSSMFMLNLSKAARSVGEDMGEATSKIAKFEALLGRAQEGSKEALDALQKLGLSPWGKTMEDAITEAAEAFRKIEDPAKRAHAAVEMFGRGGLQVVEIMEKLAEARKHGIVEQGDMDALASGFGHLRTVAVGVLDFFRDGFKVVTADWIRRISDVGEKFGLVRLDRGGMKAHQETPIEAPEKTKEQIKAEAEEAKKLAEARKEYERALEETGNLLQQEMKHAQRVRELEHDIKGIAGETVEKYKLQKELLDEQKKIKELQKQQDEERKRASEKALEYGKEYYNLSREQYRAERAINEAKADRSGWGLNDILQNPLQRNRAGYAIIPPQLFAAAQNAMLTMRGSGLSPEEITQMSVNYEQNWRKAAGAHDMGLGAKALRLLGLPDMAGKATDLELFGRKQLDALTTQEGNPMRSQLEKLEDINTNIANLYRKASNEGIKIIPTNGE